MNLTAVLDELIQAKNTGGKDQDYPQVRFESYMSQLDDYQRRRLYELYQLDFDLFGYDPNWVVYQDIKI